MIYTLYDEATGKITKIGVCSDPAEVEIQLKGEPRRIKAITGVQADPRTHKVERGKITERKEKDPIGTKDKQRST